MSLVTDLAPGAGSVWRSRQRLSKPPYKRSKITVFAVTHQFHSETLGEMPAQVVAGGVGSDGTAGLCAYPLWAFFHIYEPDDRGARELFRQYEKELNQAEEVANDNAGYGAQSGLEAGEIGGSRPR